jgi:hypothetical protein
MTKKTIYKNNKEISFLIRKKIWDGDEGRRFRNISKFTHHTMRN